MALLTPELLQKYDARVPRYTSYPTAPCFTAAVGADSYRRWLGALEPGTTLSLYLHVPFCEKLCWYCGCHTAIIHDYAPAERYTDLLLREIELVAGALPRRFEATHVHWGGGTPTILRPAEFLALADALRRRFEIGGQAAVSVEIDPRGFTAEMARTLADAGATRASLGVQDFAPAVQEAVNRIQSFEETRRAVDWLRAEGVAEINIDLIYGLPRQTRESFLATVERTLELEPQQIALFGYAHVPWMKRHQRLIDEAALPGPAARWAIYTAAAGLLRARGFVPVGLDHFAVPESELARAAAEGRLRRNFQGYTADAAPVLLGFGASAIGTLPQGYVQNAPRIAEYRAAVSAGRLATVRGRAVGPDDLLRRAVIERLMCGLEADVAAICAAHGRDADALDSAIARLAPFAADGLLEVRGRRVVVREEARPLIRSVCTAFDAYYSAEGEPRHARAI